MSAKINDMYYAYSAIDDIKEKGEYGGVVTTIMKYLLEEGIVDGVVGVTQGHDIYDGVPTLITDPADVIKTAGSIHCGTLNIAKFVSKYLDGARYMKLAVACKPCDAMTIRELMKKGKIIEENVIMIGVNCGGTMSPVPTMNMIRDVYDLDPKDVVKEEIAKGKLIMETADGEKAFKIDELEEQGMGRRENCQRCNLKIPSNADLALGNWGVIGPLAGKATFVEVFSETGAEVLGKVIGKDTDMAEDIGAIIETPGFLANYNAFKNLKFLASLTNKIDDGEIRRTIGMVGLDPYSKKKVGTFSMGMRQRLGIAQAIMEHPKILILDEPFNGLDKKGVEEMRQLLLKQKEEGKTILLASHSAEDIEILCDEVFEMEMGICSRRK